MFSPALIKFLDMHCVNKRRQNVGFESLIWRRSHKQLTPSNNDHHTPLILQPKNQRRRLFEEKFCLSVPVYGSASLRTTKNLTRPTFMQQLLPCKANFKFFQHVANTPGKFGLKFCMVLDADSKYLYKDFLYLDKDDPGDLSMSVPTTVVKKLMQYLSKHGYNVTCGNFFTPLDVAVRLAKEKSSLVGTVRQNYRELPQIAKAKQPLHEPTLFKTTTSSTSVTLPCYQCKNAKFVIMLGTLHQDVGVFQKITPKRNQRLLFFVTKAKQESMMLIRWKERIL